jgi:hypothetical protein
MTEHLPIQDPDDCTPEDMMRMAEALFAPTTPVAELERICMTLAHLPTEDAQGLLARFKRSPRAGEVSWLECAIDEGSYLLLTPTNELEEREFLTLKVIEDLSDEIVDLEARSDEVRLRRDKSEIRLAAREALAEAGKLDADLLDIDRLDIEQDNERLGELAEAMAEREAMIEYLRATITTPRYRSADPFVVRHIHLDGETGPEPPS